MLGLKSKLAVGPESKKWEPGEMEQCQSNVLFGPNRLGGECQHSAAAETLDVFRSIPMQGEVAKAMFYHSMEAWH